MGIGNTIIIMIITVALNRFWLYNDDEKVTITMPMVTDDMMHCYV